MKHLILSIAFVVVLCGCRTTEPKQLNRFESKIQQDLNNINNPNASIEKVRKFALEKLNDITDKEMTIINQNKPVIRSNYSEMEYSFTWKIKKHYLVEVVTTSAPFEPVAVYRVTRVYYP
jgi:uncharacterized FlgJ-related protein